ncbi:hypothetical protein ACHQM5_003928 [Ranunculus cassubicifolius]
MANSGFSMNQEEMLKRGQLQRPYMDIKDCFRRVFREEGFGSFWRGNHANVIRYFPTQAFNFAFKGYFQGILGRSKEKDGAAGATTSLFLYHLDFARTRLGTDSKECPINCQRQFKGLIDVYKKTLSTDSIAGLYRGFSASIVGITLIRGMYFGLYDTLKPIVLIGSLEGNFFAMKYDSALHAFRQIISQEGFFVLFGGVTANMLAGMAGAGVLAGYDQLQRFARGRDYGFETRPITLK